MEYETCQCKSSWTPIACIYENGKYLKNIANDSVILCYQIISVKTKNVLLYQQYRERRRIMNFKKSQY